ncbi:MAG: hypothetical protein ACRBB0_27165 [Pelagimonas sp.]|uniref:hypothetical protein n=1 Tax=Pelagimonas sp. TaxID=2073170 RepID=UPI003D6B0538
MTTHPETKPKTPWQSVGDEEPATTRLYAIADDRGGIRLTLPPIAPDILMGDLVDTHKVARTAAKGLRRFIAVVGVSPEMWDFSNPLQTLIKQGGAVVENNPNTALRSLTYAFVTANGPKNDDMALIKSWITAAESYASKHDYERYEALGTVMVTSGC